MVLRSGFQQFNRLKKRYKYLSSATSFSCQNYQRLTMNLASAINDGFGTRINKQGTDHQYSCISAFLLLKLTDMLPCDFVIMRSL